jgi:hypothetical protein
VEDTNVPDGNMLGTLVLNGVGGEIDSADVVAVDQSGTRQGGCVAPQAVDAVNTPPPQRGTLPARMGDNVVALRGLGDKVVTQKHRIA